MATTTTETTTETTYTKLRDGSWGVRGPAEVIVAGRHVEVTKRSGERRVERIVRVLWRGDGVAVASIAASAPSTLDLKMGRAGAAAWRRNRRERACHTDGNCSSVCRPSTCPCGDGSWFRCC